jgi:hypothetical protein
MCKNCFQKLKKIPASSLEKIRNLKNELKDTINKFKFCEMNSIENIEKYKNIENKVEWYRKIFYN